MSYVSSCSSHRTTTTSSIRRQHSPLSRNRTSALQLSTLQNRLNNGHQTNDRHAPTADRFGPLRCYGPWSGYRLRLVVRLPRPRRPSS
ncbi:hypothetical protein GMOD_00001788 [Pyrenophora seminiperda CCB06]|uniref:Uncharacterized protein n=1 Tax=Pyrenophora seminiperda CCB06 TaxID=1302712 RepID=A0A3M7LW44_9PLEO|nr:hypothetical protein GMOD_00001788 [Pyrenophora seminiperda CCB06]